MAPRKFDLAREAKTFASDLTDLLNRTVCKWVQINAVYDPSDGCIHVGNKVAPDRFAPNEAVQIGERSAGLFLGVYYKLQADHEAKYLTVVSSVLGLFGNAEMDEELLHIDYEREKDRGYPEAHIQVVASSDAWSGLLGRCSESKSVVGRLHVPAGGRRFRTTLEDLIEFVISERLVTKPNPGWQANLSISRRKFEIKQLRAAIRSYPDEASAAVREFGLIGR